MDVVTLKCLLTYSKIVSHVLPFSSSVGAFSLLIIARILIRSNYPGQGIKSNLMELFDFENYNIEYSMSILIIGYLNLMK
jgi:hypothetical protein